MKTTQAGLTTNLPRGQAWLRELHENGQEIHNAKDARDAKGAQTPYGDQAGKQETQELRKKSGNPPLRTCHAGRRGHTNYTKGILEGQRTRRVPFPLRDLYYYLATSSFLCTFFDLIHFRDCS